jgi:hypothetical protein
MVAGRLAVEGLEIPLRSVQQPTHQCRDDGQGRDRRAAVASDGGGSHLKPWQPDAVTVASQWRGSDEPTAARPMRTVGWLPAGLAT